ncbi:MAG: hypothetical protein NTV34_11335 [Proteobacteria bacterium]|nr:hypothetical protein [Pseudomonadota bacterium]
MKSVLVALSTLVLTACGAINANTSSIAASNSKLIECGEKAKNSVTIKFNRDKMTATLTTMEGQTYASHACESVPGAIEESYFCGFFSSTDSGYDVRIGSIGSSTLFGSVKTWTMVGESEAESLGQCTR